MEYKECFEIMGKDRNSYSKTDLEATFMRMKEDYMLNGQFLLSGERYHSFFMYQRFPGLPVICSCIRIRL